MSQPQRGRVVHVMRERYDVRIDRSSKWGNPFSHLALTDCTAKFHVETREEAVAKYEAWIRTQPELMAALPELRGKVLGCWCTPKACHGDVLLKLIDELDAKQESENL